MSRLLNPRLLNNRLLNRRLLNNRLGGRDAGGKQGKTREGGGEKAHEHILGEGGYIRVTGHPRLIPRQASLEVQPLLTKTW